MDNLKFYLSDESLEILFMDFGPDNVYIKNPELFIISMCGAQNVQAELG